MLFVFHKNPEDSRFLLSSLKKSNVNFKVLISDTARARKDAFRSVFGNECVTKMNWFHMEKCDEEKRIDLKWPLNYLTLIYDSPLIDFRIMDNILRLSKTTKKYIKI